MTREGYAAPAADGSKVNIEVSPTSDRLQLLSGHADLVTTPSASGKGQRIARCPVCRVALWSHYAGSGDRVSFVRVGTFDEPDRFPPDVHIYTESKQPWVLLDANVPAVPAYYDRAAHWPRESLERMSVLVPHIEAYRNSLEQQR